jgi:hypothetical protein
MARRAHLILATMASSAGPSHEDYDSAARLGLLGLRADLDSESIMTQLEGLHPTYSTFPAEVLLELAAEAIGESGSTQAEPILYEGMRDHYLPEYQFRGKYQQHKSHYALMAAAMIRGGVCPDLLDEAYGWGADDMWRYAFYALVLYARVAAERTGRPPEAVATAIAERRVSISGIPSRLQRTPPRRTRHDDRSPGVAGRRWSSSSDRRGERRSVRHGTGRRRRGQP